MQSSRRSRPRCVPNPLLRLPDLIVPQHAGTTSSAQATVDKDTEVKLQSITESYNSHKDAVVKKLLDRVVLVKPELHRNLTKLEA